MHKLLADIECTIIHTWHGVSKNSVIIQLKILTVSQVCHHTSPNRCMVQVYGTGVLQIAVLSLSSSHSIFITALKNICHVCKNLSSNVCKDLRLPAREQLPCLIKAQITLYNRAGLPLHQCQCTCHSYQTSNSHSFLLN